MRFIFSVILIVVWSAVAEFFFPWWTIAVVSFLVCLFRGGKAGMAFLSGFVGVALFWLGAALMHDIPNEHILSVRMAALFNLPNYGLFIVVTVFVGGLIGGLSGWAGALLKPKPQIPKGA